jgi:tight adherence protein C
MSPGLFASLVAAVILLGGAGLLALIYFASSARQAGVVRRRLTPGAHPDEPEEGESGPELLQKLAAGGKRIEGLVDTDNESARLLVQAGWRNPEARTVYYAAQAITPLALLGIVPVIWLFGPEKLSKPSMLLLFAAIAVIVGLLLPIKFLRATAAERCRRIKSEVPLFVHLLVLLFEAGLSTRQVFSSLVKDGRGVLPELGKEFDLVLRQIEAGGETDEVLKNLSAALDVDDLSSTLALLRQVDRYGGEVRDPLLESLKMMEERRVLDMREMVNLLSGRMTVVMVTFFFPALLIFIAGPAFLGLLKALSSVSPGG